MNLPLSASAPKMMMPDSSSKMRSQISGFLMYSRADMESACVCVGVGVEEEMWRRDVEDAVSVA